MARALEKLPRIAAAMSEGRISYFKVREMTRVADASNEVYLLNIALCGTASHVEERCVVIAGHSMPRSCPGKRSSNGTSHFGFIPSRMVRW